MKTKLIFLLALLTITSCYKVTLNRNPIVLEIGGAVTDSQGVAQLIDLNDDATLCAHIKLDKNVYFGGCPGWGGRPTDKLVLCGPLTTDNDGGYSVTLDRNAVINICGESGFKEEKFIEVGITNFVIEMNISDGKKFKGKIEKVQKSERSDNLAGDNIVEVYKIKSNFVFTLSHFEPNNSVNINKTNKEFIKN